MQNTWICSDLEQCELLWQEMCGGDGIFQQWEIRRCFQDTYQRTPCFIVCEDDDGLAGLLPLSRIDESDMVAFFPGETWLGRTWLEQNRIVARSPEVCRSLLEAVPGDADLRYIDGRCRSVLPAEIAVDETGYLFRPPEHAYCFQQYLDGLPRKKLKRLRREPDMLRGRGVTFRHGSLHDIGSLLQLNFEAFAEHSYFHDDRFLNGFERLIAELDRCGALRVTTVMVAGTIAAVDVGAVWNNSYTVLAGGANRDFPGVAKLINFHHLELACRERFRSVDFLCGDFGWKRRFRLAPRPLYQMTLSADDTTELSATICARGSRTDA